jgi:acetylornithine deacetylase/succinyl-diaminopimelate desuccinylase-like protein
MSYLLTCLLATHLDVVPVTNGVVGVIYGRGALDNKSSVMVSKFNTLTWWWWPDNFLPTEFLVAIEPDNETSLLHHGATATI